MVLMDYGITVIITIIIEKIYKVLLYLKFMTNNYREEISDRIPGSESRETYSLFRNPVFRVLGVGLSLLSTAYLTIAPVLAAPKDVRLKRKIEKLDLEAKYKREDGDVKGETKLQKKKQKLESRLGHLTTTNQIETVERQAKDYLKEGKLSEAEKAIKQYQEAVNKSNLPRSEKESHQKTVLKLLDQYKTVEAKNKSNTALETLLKGKDVRATNVIPGITVYSWGNVENSSITVEKRGDNEGVIFVGEASEIENAKRQVSHHEKFFKTNYKLTEDQLIQLREGKSVEDVIKDLKGRRKSIIRSAEDHAKKLKRAQEDLSEAFSKYGCVALGGSIAGVEELLQGARDGKTSLFVVLDKNGNPEYLIGRKFGSQYRLPQVNMSGRPVKTLNDYLKTVPKPIVPPTPKVETPIPIPEVPQPIVPTAPPTPKPTPEVPLVVPKQETKPAPPVLPVKPSQARPGVGYRVYIT